MFEIDSTQSDKAQEFVIRSIQFVGERLASTYARSKMNLVSPKPGSPAPTEEQIEAIREQARAFNYWREYTEMDIDSRNVADFLCGLSGTVTPSERAISETSEAHGISREQASDMLRASRLDMLAKSQAKNLHKQSSIIGWLMDVEKFGVSEDSDTREQVEALIANALIEQYRQAGRYASLAGRYVVESYAKQYGVILPDWKDVLPKWTEQSSKELERITRIQAEEADRRQQEEARISLDLQEQFGDF